MGNCLNIKHEDKPLTIREKRTNLENENKEKTNPALNRSKVNDDKLPGVYVLKKEDSEDKSCMKKDFNDNFENVFMQENSEDESFRKKESIATTVSESETDYDLSNRIKTFKTKTESLC